MDLVVVYTLFNIGLFAALSTIAGGNVSIGVGLFAVLSIVRLRSEPYSNRELAYFFAALVLGLVWAIDLEGIGLPAILTGAVLVATFVVDHPRVARPSRRLEVTLESAFADRDELRRELEGRLGEPVLGLSVLDIDYVREITRVLVSCAAETAPDSESVPDPVFDDRLTPTAR